MASSSSFPGPFFPRFHRTRKGGVGLVVAGALAYAAFHERPKWALLSNDALPNIISKDSTTDDKAPWFLVGRASPFACLASAVAEGLPSAAPSSTLKEPNTGVSFPTLLLEEGQQQLAGVGLRKKSLLGLKNITVYAFGVYANEASLKDQLSSKYGQQPVSVLKENKDFYDDVIASDVDLTVRLVIVYARLKIGSVRSAFKESIGSRIKKFSGLENKPLLESFTKMFRDDIELPQGTTIDITRHPGHVLQTKINGSEVGAVQSALLCRAFFDLYMGEDPFDVKGKEDIGSSLASLISK